MTQIGVSQSQSDESDKALRRKEFMSALVFCQSDAAGAHGGMHRVVQHSPHLRVCYRLLKRRLALCS